MKEILTKLNIKDENPGGFDGKWFGGHSIKTVTTPINGSDLAKVKEVNKDGLNNIISSSHNAYQNWSTVPAPKRGEIVNQIGQEIKKHKEDLGKLITLEMGKSIQESLGEVQEMIDICDFATGLSRQLYGLTMQSERSKHRMFEQWHPLGVIGIITAFNFPAAVWAWNTAIALVCGNTTLWKPSSKTSLTAIACINIAHKVLERNGFLNQICNLAIGRGGEIGDEFISDKRVALVSYTGSVSKGRHVGEIVQKRFGKLILELGGNNAVIVTKNANLDVALKSIYFGAIGTSGQRCTSTRRVIIHEDIYNDFIEKLISIYQKTAIGNPLDKENLMGPLVDIKAVDTMMIAISTIKKQGGKILYGGEKINHEGGCYVTPCIVNASRDLPMMQEETFAPILYMVTYKTLEEAIATNNEVPQGLSSAIITDNLLESEFFLSSCGSDCGIANVNLGTSGAEIGGAFGGEKETGGGRESGSDAWKSYMRRQTNTINYSSEIALAQNLKFTI